MRTLFCATENDIHHRITQLESSYVYYYIRYGYSRNPDIKFISSIRDYYNLFQLNPSDEQPLENYLLVIRKNSDIEWSMINNHQKLMNVMYSCHTPCFILFSPGGRASHDCLAAGWISAHISNPSSVEMFRYFSRTLRRGFTRLGNYWFGPEALQMVMPGMKFIPAGHKNLAEGIFHD